MKINDALRLIAGVMVLILLGLAVTHSTNWLWLPAARTKQPAQRGEVSA